MCVLCCFVFVRCLKVNLSYTCGIYTHYTHTYVVNMNVFSPHRVCLIVVPRSCSGPVPMHVSVSTPAVLSLRVTNTMTSRRFKLTLEGRRGESVTGTVHHCIYMTLCLYIVVYMGVVEGCYIHSRLSCRGWRTPHPSKSFPQDFESHNVIMPCLNYYMYMYLA